MNNAHELVTAHMELNPDGQPVIYHPGLTKREHFAGLALQGLLSSEVHASPEVFAKYAVKAADALLAALDSQQGGE